MVFKNKGVVPVRHVFEFNCFAGPMRLGYGNALQNGSFDCLRGHIGGGFNVLPVCSAVGIAGYIVNFFAGSSMAMLMVAFIVTGIASLPGAYLQAPMLMECSSYNEMLGLPRMDSTSAAVMNFMIKFMNALGAGLMGLLLQASGFIATKSGEVVTQPGSAMLMIRILYSIVPTAALFVVILAAKHFDGLGKKLKENGKQ